MTGHRLHALRLNLDPNEASGLVDVADDAILERYGWDHAFWTVLDEADVDDAIGVIGHLRDAAEDDEAAWETRKLAVRRSGDDDRACDDAESITRRGDEVWVLGSQHGGKDGPIRKREAWVARFVESASVEALAGGDPVVLEIVRTPLTLHRVVNDALRTFGVEVTPMGPHGRAAFIDRTFEKGDDDFRRHVLRRNDVTINVEGAAFQGERLLLGLRYPVAADGRPLVAVVRDPDELFTGGAPTVEGFWVLDAVGRDGTLAGVRDLCLDGDELHVVTGNLDSRDKGSVLLLDHPEGRATVNTHFVCRLPAGEVSGELACEVVREFPDLPRVEGIARSRDGHFHYVSDENEGVQLRFTRLVT